MSREKKDIFCFVHIEKSGGSTIHTLLHREHFGYITPHPGYGRFFTADHLKKLKRLYPIQLRGLGGHRLGAYLGYEDVLPTVPRYFTFLRQPVNRFMSMMNWRINVMGQSWTPESFTAQSKYANLQTFRIAGEQNLDKAKEAIDKNFAFVGLIEHFDESMFLLKNEMGWSDMDLRYTEENVKDYGKKRIRWEDLDQDLQEQIIACNKLDSELYEYAKNHLFETYKSRYPGDLSADVKALKEANQSYRQPNWVKIKQKASNIYLGQIVQPLFSKRIS